MIDVENYLAGRWQSGTGEGQPLTNPLDGRVLARVSTQGLDLAEALDYAREHGGSGLRRLGFAARAALLSSIAGVLADKREDYYRISLENSGSGKDDAAIDIEGAIFTLKTYASLGKKLGDATRLTEGDSHSLSKTGDFSAQHFLLPMQGAAVLINAFNFPAWSLWEKAAGALLSGMPVLAKPATASCWLTQRMVRDVIEAGILPEGALSVMCGSAGDLLDHLDETDVVSFTGSADTAARIRTHPNLLACSVRINVEADSINSAIVGTDVEPDSEVFALAVREIVREMTVKAGQKCTAIRRVLVPQSLAGPLADALVAKLAACTVGDPAEDGVRVGPLVNEAQARAARQGVEKLRSECAELYSGQDTEGALFAPVLLRNDKGVDAEFVNDIEVFGPVATLMPYTDIDEAIAIARRGRGSLVASVYSDEPSFIDPLVAGIADLHGRVMVVDSMVGKQHTGHGNVMPTCQHGGPGRAGGGEELGGLRALNFYHRRVVVQGSPRTLQALAAQAVSSDLLYS
ncbi:MAG: 3,4-dehydroadipyl-CoA semialdehyde dehydrogenase [Gammaproteobacteria bacterium]|nr:3,4-dehydroadipyl-CoA semialdehyde dehydrogenase [Gammaproteobacteria bacterium]